MALIERDGKVYARKLWIYLGPKEWGNELMCSGCEGSLRHRPQPGCCPGQRARWLVSDLICETARSSAQPTIRLISMTKLWSSSNSIYGYDSAGEIRRP